MRIEKYNLISKKELIIDLLYSNSDYAFDMKEILEKLNEKMEIGRSNLYKLMRELCEDDTIKRKKIGNKFFYYSGE